MNTGKTKEKLYTNICDTCRSSFEDYYESDECPDCEMEHGD